MNTLSIIPAPARHYDILDAGCGTGLCGPLLRPYARRLTGVDLSPGMLEKARARGLYDSLLTAELTEHMSGSYLHYDLIVSADTLVYFGRLDPAFRAAAKALRPGGLLAFSLEHLVDGASEAGFRLNPHGRYSHTRECVCRTLLESKFAVRSITTETLRMEKNEPVTRLVVVARKQTASS